MTEINHVTRATHEDGQRLRPPQAWCGAPLWMGWNFIDAQHAALSIAEDNYASWYVCLDCVDQIIATLAKADQQRGDGATPRKAEAGQCPECGQPFQIGEKLQMWSDSQYRHVDHPPKDTESLLKVHGEPRMADYP